MAIAEIESLINTYTSRGLMDEGQVEEVEMTMNFIIENHPARADFKVSDQFEAELNISEDVEATSSF